LPELVGTLRFAHPRILLAMTAVKCTHTYPIPRRDSPG